MHAGSFEAEATSRRYFMTALSLGSISHLLNSTHLSCTAGNNNIIMESDAPLGISKPS